MNSSDFAKVQRTDTSKIPVIDVSGAINRTGLEGVAADIYQAATDYGFFYISGHGISPSMCRKAFSISKKFF